MREKKILLSKIIFILLMVFLITILVFYINNIKTNPILMPKCHDCNVIIITPTDIGAKHMSLYGYERDTTPNIDKFAEKSIVFTSAFSPISWSLPAAASLFTSEYPFTHGLMGRNVLDPKEVTLAEILKLYNYTTAAFTGGGDYRSIYGISQGFDIFDDNDKSVIFTGSLNRSTNAALEWLKNNKDKKFFMFVEGYDAHCPFNPPEEYRTLFEQGYNGKLNDSLCVRGLNVKTKTSRNLSEPYIEAVYFENMTISPNYAIFVKVNVTSNDVGHLKSMYDSEIRYADYTLGNFLDSLHSLGILDKTIIIIAGDHGEIFDRNGELIRFGALRGTFYDDVIHVPLIISHPHLKKGEKIDGLAQTIDVMPTILDLLSIPVNHEAQGRSLLPMVNNRSKSIHDYVFSGGRFGSGKSKLFSYMTIHDSIRGKKWKLIFERSLTGEIFIFELYDVEKDTNETNNLIAQEPEIARELKDRLRDWEKSSVKAKKLKEVNLTDAELRAAMEAGYTG